MKRKGIVILSILVISLLSIPQSLIADEEVVTIGEKPKLDQALLDSVFATADRISEDVSVYSISDEELVDVSYKAIILLEKVEAPIEDIEECRTLVVEIDELSTLQDPFCDLLAMKLLQLLTAIELARIDCQIYLRLGACLRLAVYLIAFARLYRLYVKWCGEFDGEDGSSNPITAATWNEIKQVIITNTQPSCRCSI